MLTECVKCLCRNVREADVGFCVVVVFVEKLEVCQHSYTRGLFRVYKHLNGLNSERPQTEDAEALRYDRKSFV